MEKVRVNHDDSPDEVATNFIDVLIRAGFDIGIIYEPKVPWIDYEITRKEI